MPFPFSSPVVYMFFPKISSACFNYTCTINVVRPSNHVNKQSFSPNSSYISIVIVNFESLTVRLHILIIFFMHVKFQEDQKLIAISSNNVKISNFYDLKLCIRLSIK